jgi:hypothetical protein
MDTLAHIVLLILIVAILVTIYGLTIWDRD